MKITNDHAENFDQYNTYLTINPEDSDEEIVERMKERYAELIGRALIQNAHLHRYFQEGFGHHAIMRLFVVKPEVQYRPNKEPTND